VSRLHSFFAPVKINDFPLANGRGDGFVPAFLTLRRLDGEPCVGDTSSPSSALFVVRRLRLEGVLGSALSGESKIDSLLLVFTREDLLGERRGDDIGVKDEAGD
jgi:hypothetical protein